jgi:squalene monooxygenase
MLIDFPEMPEGKSAQLSPCALAQACIAVDPSLLLPCPAPPTDDAALVRHFHEAVLPQLPPCIHASFLQAVASKRWQSMPNQSLCTDRPNVPVGAFVIGDSLNMRHPLTGGGMTVGFTDVELARDVLAGVKDWHAHGAVHDRVNAFYERRRGRSAVINILADALYQVFLEKNPDLRDACFDYLGFGKVTYGGPVSLLSG